MYSRTIIIAVTTLVDISLLLYSSIAKLSDLDIYQAERTDSGILGTLPHEVTICVSIIEIVIVGLLAFPRWRIKGLKLTSLAMALFIVYTITLEFADRNELSCGCGGAIDKLTIEQHLALNLFVLSINIAAIISLRKERKSAFRKWSIELDHTRAIHSDNGRYLNHSTCENGNTVMNIFKA